MEELDLRLKAGTKLEAALALHEYLTKQCGVLFLVRRTIRPLEEESPGVWRCKVVVDSFLPKKKNSENGRPV